MKTSRGAAATTRLFRGDGVVRDGSLRRGRPYARPRKVRTSHTATTPPSPRRSLGGVVVATNPFERLTGVYDDPRRFRAADDAALLEPHPYALAEQAVRGLVRDRTSQALLVFRAVADRSGFLAKISPRRSGAPPLPTARKKKRVHAQADFGRVRRGEDRNRKVRAPLFERPVRERERRDERRGRRPGARGGESFTGSVCQREDPGRHPNFAAPRNIRGRGTRPNSVSFVALPRRPRRSGTTTRRDSGNSCASTWIRYPGASRPPRWTTTCWRRYARLRRNFFSEKSYLGRRPGTSASGPRRRRDPVSVAAATALPRPAAIATDVDGAAAPPRLGER